jgi:hypothetical protein
MGGTDTVADDLRMALNDLLRKGELTDADFLREGVRVLAQAVMELELSQHVGAERYERSPDRRGERNGYRDRQWDTRVGTVELAVPRVRDGSFFPGLSEPRRRAERALTAVVQEAYVHGVSTRRVDDLVKALGMTGISKSQVSRLCQELDAENPIEDYLTGLRLLEGVADDVDVLIPGHGSVGGADQVRARIEQDRAYVHALRDGGVPDDPRIGPSATFSKDWPPGVYEWQLQQLAKRTNADEMRRSA